MRRVRHPSRLPWRRLVSLTLLAGCSGGLPLPLPLPLPIPTPAPAPTGGGGGRTPAASAVEREVHDLVNRHRRARGLADLAFDERLSELAREHSQAMAGGRRPFGHDGFEARSAAIQREVPAGAVAENVAYHSATGPDLPAIVVQGWVASAGHRKNIEGAFHLGGVGVAVSPDGVRYFTQIFAARR